MGTSRIHLAHLPINKFHAIILRNDARFDHACKVLDRELPALDLDTHKEMPCERRILERFSMVKSCRECLRKSTSSVVVAQSLRDMIFAEPPGLTQGTAGHGGELG